MSIQERAESFVEFLSEHSEMRDGALVLHVRHHRAYDDFVEDLSERTFDWHQYADILAYLQLRTFDPTGELSRDEFLDIFQRELLELLEAPELPDDRDDDDTSEEWDEEPRQPVQHRPQPAERRRDASPERPMVGNFMQRIQQQRRRELQAIRVSCVREATVVALKFLGEASCKEIAHFIRMHSLWGGLRCSTAHISSMMWQDRFTVRGYRVYEQRLFTHPSLQEFDSYYSRQQRMRSWTYALSDLGEALYEDRLRPRQL